MKFYIAEFQKPFLDFLSATADAAPLELFSNPNVYLHNILVPDSCPVPWRTAKTLTARITDLNFAYHPKLETTQIITFLQIEGGHKNFSVYASMVNDAYRNKSARRFARSMFTTILERRMSVDLDVREVDGHSVDGKLLLDTFYPINWESVQ
jgi:hypothetical protein